MHVHQFLLASSLSTIALGQVLIDPRTRYANRSLDLPPAGFPSLETSFAEPPDHGETSYVGRGRLRGRHALITGGDSGIGRSIALAFVREGAHVAINYLPAEGADAQSLVDYLRGENATVIRLPGDLRNETFCHNLVHEAYNKLGGLDILVSNAAYNGILAGPDYMTVTNLTTAVFDQIIHTNIYPSFFLARAAVLLMPPGSNIIYTSSTSIETPIPELLPYASSKAWIAYWARALAGQLLSLGIRVNTVLPGIIYTPFLPAGGYNTKELEALALAQPGGRIAQPAEIAPVYVDIADPQNSFASGGFWNVEG